MEKLIYGSGDQENEVSICTGGFMELDVNEVANKIEKNGGRLYLVGGAVRDEFLGKEVSDEDYCVTGLSSEEFCKLFPEVYARGKSFEVYDSGNGQIRRRKRDHGSGVCGENGSDDGKK